MGLERWLVILKESLTLNHKDFSIGSTGLRFTLTTFLISWVSLSQASFLMWRCSALLYSLAFKSFFFFLKQPVIPIMWIYCSTLYSVQVNHLFIFTHTAHCPLVCSFVNLYNRSWSQNVLAFSLDYCTSIELQTCLLVSIQKHAWVFIGIALYLNISLRRQIIWTHWPISLWIWCIPLLI